MGEYISSPCIQFEAGRLKYFVKEWESLTSDPAILSIVSGLEIELVDNAHPVQVTVPRQIAFNTQEVATVSKEIDKLLDKKVIRSVKPCSGQFVSTMFVRPKPEFSNDPYSERFK